MNMAFINTLILGKYMPFSRPVAEQQKGGNILYNILVIFVLSLMVALHYVLKFLPFYATWILTGLSLALALLLYNKIRKLEWRAIQQSP
jgi:F0F1-type ATP synthase assembly protein I